MYGVNTASESTLDVGQTPWPRPSRGPKRLQAESYRRFASSGWKYRLGELQAICRSIDRDQDIIVVFWTAFGIPCRFDLIVFDSVGTSQPHLRYLVFQLES